MIAPPLDALLALTLRATLVVLVAAALAAALRNTSAAARHALWTAATLTLLLLPPLALTGWGVQLPLLPAAASPPAPPVAAAASPGVPDETPLPSSGATGHRRSDEPTARSAATVYRVGALVYLAGVAVVALRFLAGLLAARGIARRARPWGLEGSARLLLSVEIPTPVTWGHRRPVVVLPATAPGWPPAERRRALLHELAHVERGDWRARALARLACALYWFNPLVWWMERRLVLEAERAADDRVLAGGASSHRYARQLLRLATGRRRQEMSLGLPLARRRHLDRRIAAILDPRQRRTTMTRPNRLLVTAAICAALAAVATARLTTATPAPHRPARWERGADGSPLIAAAAAGDLARVERLLAAGAEVDAWVDGDENALYNAIRHGHPEVVRALLAAGADFDAEWPGDGNPLVVAVRAGDPTTLDLLLGAGADVDRGVAGDGNALIVAARRGDLDLTLRLIAAGADVDAGVPGDGSPLIAAAGAGHLEIVRLLVESGADLERVVPGDENPLIQAAGAGQLEVVRYLVDQGADVNARVRTSNYRGGTEIRTPLNQADRHEHTDVADYLRSVGARR